MFETHQVAVGELFAGNAAFKLPIFQRAYCWKEEQASQLLDDLQTGYEKVREEKALNTSGSYYFIGPIILCRGGISGTYDIVDGQQRLITLSVLLAVLRDLLPDGPFRADLQKRLTRAADSINEVEEGARIEVREINREFYTKLVCEMGGTLQLAADANGVANLQAVMVRFREDIGTPINAYVEGLARYILERTYAVKMEAKTLDDAFLLFRSVNTPGEPLSSLDLVKGELLAWQRDDRVANRLAEAWERAEQGLGREKLEAFLITLLGFVAPQYERGDIKTVLRRIDAQALTGFKRNLGRFIGVYSGLDEATLDFGADSAAINYVAACFNGLPFEEWRPIALLWLSKGPSSRNALAFLRRLNALCLAFLILSTPKTHRLKRLDAIHARIKSGDVLSSAGSELFLTEREHTEIQKKLSSSLSLNAHYLKPLLLRIDAEMQEQPIPPCFPTTVTIEHVLPQTPGARWRNLFPDAAKRKKLSGSIGNLTIITHQINSSIRSNDFPSKKRDIFRANGNQAFALNQRLAAMEKWDEATIKERGEELLQLADRVLLS